MFFLNPTYLWALFGLLVPIAIHLWSKKEGKTIKVGSTKLLSESDSKQSRSIQLNEFFLLILRMMLIGILVLLIAGFQIKRKASTIPVTYIIEPSLMSDERINTILDTLETGASLRLLQPGFPELEKDQFDTESLMIPNYWQLTKEMETLETDSIVVFTNIFKSGVKGARPQVTKNITWVPLDPEESVNKVLKVIKKEDAIEVVSLTSNQYELSFKKEVLSVNNRFTFNSTNDSVIFPLNGKQEVVPLITEIPTKVLLFYEDSLANEKVYVDASLRAISKYLHKQINIQTVERVDSSNLSEFDVVVWLSSVSIPTTSTKLLVYKPDHFADRIIEKGSSNTIFYLTESLTTQNSMDRNLLEQLIALFGFHEDIKDEMNQYDKRTMDVAELKPIENTIVSNKKQFELFNISKWLWLLLVILLITERSIAKLRKQ